MTVRSAAPGLETPGQEWWRPDPRPAGVPAAAMAGPAAMSDPRAAGGIVPFVALVAFMVIMLLAPQAWLPALSPLRLAMVTGSIAIGAHLLESLFRGRPLSVRSREMTLAACLAAWAILMVPLSTWPGGALAFLLDVFIKSLAIFWLIANIVKTRGRFRTLALALTIVSVPLATVAVNHFLAGDVTEGSTGYGGGVHRIVGYDAPLTENPNDLALMLNLLLPFAIATLQQARGGLKRTLLLGVVILDACAVVLTFSRAGFLTLALTLTAYLWILFKGEGRGWAVAIAVIALMAVPLLPGSYLHHMGTITDISSDPSGSAQARWAGMITAAKLAVRNPVIGAGAGMDILALTQAQGPAWKEVHNVYLEYAVDLGLPGLALFLALFGSCYASARRAQRFGEAHPGFEALRHDGTAVKVSLGAFAVAAMFHPVGYHPYFFIIAGLSVALATIQKSEAVRVAY